LYSFQTLHDFVLNLLDDEAAKAAYAADPLGALSDAGLGDLTPQDVDEVLPLVADALPTAAPADLPLVGDLVDLDVDTLASDTGATSGFVALGGVDNLAYAGGLMSQDATGADLWAGTQTVAGQVAGAVRLEDGFVETGVATPVVYAGANTHGDYVVTTADPAVLLDDLSSGAGATVAAATTIIGTGAGALNSVVDSGADTLSSFLAGTPAAPAAGVVDSGADTVTQTAATSAGTVNQAVGTVPSVDTLPVSIDDLPVELPETPDVASTVSDLPAQLPVDLPDLGVDPTSVTSVVSDSPVGGLTDTVAGVTDDLPLAGDLTDHLSLGL
jgi:hypothetical protein